MPRPMKDSGVEWLGEIPAHWNCCKLKYLISSLNSGTSITTTDLTDEGYPVYGGGQQIGFFPQFNMEDTLIIGRVGSCGCVTKISGKAWATDNALIVTTDFPKDYLYYILVAAELNKLSTSNAQPLITSGKVLNHKVAVPPLDEQQRIATFLDGECARIDSVIEKTRASIVEYKKLKQAIITRAVTKGIRPARTMKDSGVEWLGEIPTDWEILSFTKTIRSIVDYRGKTPEKQDEGTLLVTARNIKDGKIDYECSREFVRTEDFDEIMHRGKVEIGDVLFTTEAPLGVVANADRTDFALAQRIVKFQGFPEVLNNYYLKYWIMSNVFQQNLATFSTGSTAKGIKASKLSMLKQILPPLDEQKEIAQYLDEKTAAIDLLVEKKNQLVTELERLKKSLIFEYVTGKKELTGGDLV